MKTLESQNASFFLAYFPPQTLTSRAADFQLRWYSADMYALGERPIWPPSGTETTYRFTYLPAFTGPTVITLTVSPDGEGRIAIKTITGDREITSLDETVAVPGDRLARFFTLLDQAHFWATPTELPRRGKDGAEWIMEGRLSAGAPTSNASLPRRSRLLTLATSYFELADISTLVAADFGFDSWKNRPHHQPLRSRFMRRGPASSPPK